MPNDSYGDDLRRWRREHDVTQAELADALGYRNSSAVHRRERGAIEMSPLDFAEAVIAVWGIARERHGNDNDSA